MPYPQMSQFDDCRTADEIRARMQRTRSELQPEIGRIVKDANTLMDWHYYLQRAPWLVLCGVSVVGYLLVPRRMNVMSPDAETLEKLSRKKRLVVEPHTKRKAKTGPFRGFLRMATMTAVRGGLGYVSNYFGKRLEEASKSSHEPVSQVGGYS